MNFDLSQSLTDQDRLVSVGNCLGTKSVHDNKVSTNTTSHGNKKTTFVLNVEHDYLIAKVNGSRGFTGTLNGIMIKS